MTVTFITVGNTGLGYESAKRLKKLGHRIDSGCKPLYFLIQYFSN
ncbi:hypothetical protein [Clostridioides sp. ES-S-0108-01]